MKKIIIVICVIGMILMSFDMSISAKTGKSISYDSMPQNLNECPTNITVDEAWNMLTDTGNGIQIPIDVRTKNEWANGYIDTPWPECPIWYTMDLFYNETWLSIFMEEYAGQDVVIYCAGGTRSIIVSLLLCDAGFTGTIYNMLGGITEWIKQGYPTRYNTQPDRPIVDGPTTVNVNQPMYYTFSATDPENDGIYYWVDWCGEGHCGSWQGPYASGEDVIFNHTWEKKGKYTIKAKVKDFYGNESDWTEFKINVPRNKAFNYKFLEILFERFPQAFKILKYNLGL